MLKVLIDLMRDPSEPSTPLKYKILKEDNSKVVDAIFYNDNSKRWYWTENSIGYFLPEDTTYINRKSDFYNKYSSEFSQLGLSKPAGKVKEDDFTGLVKQQQEHFDWYAKNDTQSYEAYANMSFWRAVDKTIFGRWLPQIKDEAFVLDMGCANGRSSRALWNRNVNIIGMDVSADLLVNYKEILSRENIKATVSLFAADAMHLPFAPEMFDNIIVYGVFHHVPEPSGAMRNLWQTLKKGGALFSMENNKTVFRKVFDWLMKINPIWHEEAGSQPCIGKKDVKSWINGFNYDLKIQTSVWLPPHLVNKFSDNSADKILRVTNTLGQITPLMNNNGGLIEFEIHKK